LGSQASRCASRRRCVSYLSHKKQQLLFGFIVGIEASAVFLAFSIGIFGWQFFSVNGIPVLTYYNLLSIILFIYGLILLVDVIRKLRKRDVNIQ
jgi:hypothetical protein